MEKYDNKFVFTNPGLLKLPVEQIYAGGESKARNQNIQTMFRMIGFGENIGSGFPLILSAWNEKHWLRPELIEQPELLQVKLVLHIDPINDPINDPIKSLSDTEQKVFEAIRLHPNANRQKISEILGVSDATVKRVVQNLKAHNLIRRKGSNKTGSWEIL